MVVPSGNPGEILVIDEKIKIGAVSCNAFPVIIESINSTVWLRYPSYGFP